MSPTLVRIANPIIWSLPGNVARKLRGFARVEAESVLEMRAAAALTDDPARRALYLKHALDEARHARVFSRAATDIDGKTEPAHVIPEDLFERLGEERFLAFVHRGERRGRRQFESYVAHFKDRDPRLAGVFEGVLEDERRHEAYTGELLSVVSGSPGQARAALRWARAWEAWRTWLRAGRATTQAIYLVLMLALYLLLTPVALIVRLARPARIGFRRAGGP